MRWVHVATAKNEWIPLGKRRRNLYIFISTLVSMVRRHPLLSCLQKYSFYFFCFLFFFCLCHTNRFIVIYLSHVCLFACWMSESWAFIIYLPLLWTHLYRVTYPNIPSIFALQINCQWSHSIDFHPAEFFWLASNLEIRPFPGISAISRWRWIWLTKKKERKKVLACFTFTEFNKICVFSRQLKLISWFSRYRQHKLEKAKDEVKNGDEMLPDCRPNLNILIAVADCTPADWFS